MTYAHLDLEDLELKLKESKANIKLIVTDGVFSMDAEVQRQHIYMQVIVVFVFSKSIIFVIIRWLPCRNSVSWLTSTEQAFVLTIPIQLGSGLQSNSFTYSIKLTLCKQTGDWKNRQRYRGAL